jgi:histidinol-phosphate aminotransferase
MMPATFTSQQERDFLQRGFTRRSFGRIATLLSAGAALPITSEFAVAQMSRVEGGIPAGAVRLNANENPLGPCPEALDAVFAAARQGGRYFFEEEAVFQQTLAETEGLSPDRVAAYAGSGLALYTAVIAFASPQRSLVIADPSYEMPEGAARFIGAKIIKVPLTKNYAHDVRAMAKADPNAGLFYVCSPNNPTGTLTSRADIEWLLANKPAGSVVLLDEAYLHFSGAAPCSDLVKAGKDLVILRTFSKLYGMAGLRAGAAMARPDLLQRLRSWSSGALPSTGMVAGTASLKVKNIVPERRKIVKDVREETFAFLDKHDFHYVPSVSNKFMVDTGRPGGDVIRAMREHNVYIGRVWPVWPTYVRVTIGTREEMAKFQSAWMKVLRA